MKRETITQLLQQGLQQLLPGEDVTEGSTAYQMVIEPVLSRLGSDMLETDPVSFLEELVRQENPGTLIEPGGPFTETVLSPMVLMFDPIREERVTAAKMLAPMANAASLGEDELDQAMESYFSRRRQGKYSITTVRAFYATPTSDTFSPTDDLTEKTGLIFLPTSQQSITSDEMLLNTSGKYYYFDVIVRAEKPGAE